MLSWEENSSSSFDVGKISQIFVKITSHFFSNVILTEQSSTIQARQRKEIDSLLMSVAGKRKTC